VLKKVIGVAKSVIKSPITTAALGVVTGGAAIAPLAAANVALRIADSAIKPGKKGKAARAVLRTSVKAANRDKAKRKKVKLLKAKLAQKKLITPKLLGQLQARAMKKVILARKARVKTLSPGARAADFLVNVHLA